MITPAMIERGAAALRQLTEWNMMQARDLARMVLEAALPMFNEAELLALSHACMLRVMKEDDPSRVNGSGPGCSNKPHNPMTSDTAI